MKNLIAIDTPNRYLSVTWQVNNFCNFRCSYCNPGNWSGTNKFGEPELLEVFINNFEFIISKYEKIGYTGFKFFFSGGEPTAWRHFIPICEWLKYRLPTVKIAVNTNLSRPLEWWKKHYSLFDDIVASFHVEDGDKTRYEENSIFLCDKVNYLATKMLMHEDRFWEVVEFGNHLKNVMPNYFIEWTPLFDEMSVNAGPWQYKDELKTAFFESNSIETRQTLGKPEQNTFSSSENIYEDNTRESTNSNEIIVNRKNYFMNWNCDVGDSIFINPMGEVSHASCGQLNSIGHIVNDVSGVGPQTIICKKEHCHCGTDIIIPKRKQ